MIRVENAGPLYAGATTDQPATTPSAAGPLHVGDTVETAEGTLAVVAVAEQPAPRKRGRPKKGEVREPAPAKARRSAPPMPMLQASPALSRIVGSEPIKRTDVVRGVWVHIHNLGLCQGQTINPDPVLADVTGAQPFHMMQLAGKLSAHLSAA